MKFYTLLFTLFILTITACEKTNNMSTENIIPKGRTAIAIHGGAGNLKKLELTPEQEQEYIATLKNAINTGNQILQNGGSAVDAVEATIIILENSPLFNAGIGAVYTHDAQHELDAAIMSGIDLQCGAIAGVKRIPNPISAARKVMEYSDFVLLSGSGAEEFAVEQNINLVENSYFDTPHRLEQLQQAIKEDSVELDHSGKKNTTASKITREENKYGTVGCVALDKNGNIAAGTSTGGLTNKRYGRIGDSPLIGSGTYADNNTCAVSCTGKGEDFIRINVAHDISSLISYKNLPLDSAVNFVIHDKLKNIKGRGGCIAINQRGEIAMEFTTTGMFRASIDTSGKLYTAIYKD
jgi:L-asparaginase / beta-aspartyl-peptidase